MSSVRDVYELWASEAYANLKEELGQSLAPRGRDWLFELFTSLGPSPGELLLDVGARDAKHAIRLAQEHGLRVTALDSVPLHCDLARQAVADAGVEVAVVEGRAEELPCADESVDWIWCRDVLSHVDLEPALVEFARVLAPSGSAVVYVTVPTNLLEPLERETVAPHGHTADAIELAAAAAGLVEDRVERLGSEWREHMIEAGEWDATADLLRLARSERRRPELVEQYGEWAVDVAQNGFRWGIYQLLGKLCPTVYVWSKTSSA